MASKSVSIVALLFSVLILCLQGTYAYRIGGDASAEAASASASASASVLIVALLFSVPILCLQSIYAYCIGRDASASGAIEGGFGNGNWDSQGYGDDEERTAAPRKKRFVWTKPLKVKFLQAITQIGLDNATPKRILEFMNEPDLTIKNVASHLQKYRKFLVKLKDAVVGDEDEREELGKSSFALGYRELLFNNKRDQQLLNQQQMEISIGSTFQVQPSAGIGSSSQQQDGGHDQDQLPYQVEVPDPAANQVPNPSADQVSNPGPYHVEDNHETILEPGMPTVFESEDLNICLHTCQQQDGGHDQDQLPYQVEVPDPAANQVPNPSADQVPNPGPYHVEDNHETILEPGMPTVFESEDLNICLHTCQNIYGTLIRNWN